MSNVQKNLLSKPTLLAVCISLAVSANAEDQPTKLESIVVVGEATNTVVTPEELERYQATDLEDIFRGVPSVSVGGSLDFAQKVYVRGLEDTQLNVTVDGAPQTGTQFHHTGRISVDPELLKSVEVQEGAGEATSGAGAIGGAIRFETKDADDLLEPGESFGGLIKGTYYSNDGVRLSTSLYGKLNDNWGILTSYIRNDQDDFDDGFGDKVFGSGSDQSLIFGKINGNITDNQEISLSVEQRSESGDYNTRPNWFTTEDSILYPLDRDRETIVFNHSFNPNDAIDLETTVYHTETTLEQDGRFGLYQGRTKSTGLDIKNTSKFAAHTLTYGLDYREDTVTAKSLEGTEAGFKEEGTVLGLYAQDHWQLTDKLLLSYGARYDNYDLDQVTLDDSTDSDDISPNIGLSFDLDERITLSVGHARAMRGKEIGDAYTLSIAAVDAAGNAISLDPDLEAETVANTEIGIEFNEDNYGFKVALFKMVIDDVIQDQSGNGTFYENIGELESVGFEIGGFYEWDKAKVEASFSHSEPELNGYVVEGYEHLAIGNVRGDTFNLNAQYSITPQLDFGWNYTHVSGLSDIGVLQYSVELGYTPEEQTIDKPGYDIHDISLRWKPASVKDLTVDFAVQNVFDKAYIDHSSISDYTGIDSWENVSGVYERGRDFRASIQYKF